MSALDDMPNTQNFLSPTGGIFRAKRLPATVFYCQKVSIPSIALQPIKLSNPFNKLPFVGDHIDFGTFSINFKIDEQMQNYQELFNWIIATGFPDNYEEYALINANSKASGEWIMSDASTIVLDAQNNPVISIDYKNIFPISLSADDFDPRDTNINYMSAACVFVCESYKFTSQRIPTV